MPSYPEAVNSIAANTEAALEVRRSIFRILTGVLAVLSLIFLVGPSIISVSIMLVCWLGIGQSRRSDRKATRDLEDGLEALKNPIERIMWAYPVVTYVNGKGITNGLRVGLEDGRLVSFVGAPRFVEAALDTMARIGITVGYSKANKKAFRESPRSLATAPRPVMPREVTEDAEPVVVPATQSAHAKPEATRSIADLAKELRAGAEAGRKPVVWIFGIIVAYIDWRALMTLLHHPNIYSVLVISAVGVAVTAAYVVLIRHLNSKRDGVRALAHPLERIVWAYPEYSTRAGAIDVGGVNLGLPDGRLVKLYAKPQTAEQTLAALEKMGVTVGYSDARKEAFRRSPRSLIAAA